MTDVKAPPSLLPDNNKESASSIYTRKIIVICLSVVLLIGLCLAVIHQYHLRYDDFAKLRTQVEKALITKDESELIKLAAHEFTIGQPELGSGAIVTPEKVIGKVIQLASKIKWSDRIEDFESLRILYPEKGTVQLTFTNTPSGWVWSGVQSVSPDEVAFLASDAPTSRLDEKVQYQDINTEEAKGDEPTMEAHP